MPKKFIDREQFKKQGKTNDGECLRKQTVTNVTMIDVKDLPEDQRKIAKESDVEKAFEFIISTQSIDRDGDTINVEGWDVRNFNKNPVLPWAHIYNQPPVGRSLAVWRNNNALNSNAIFTSKELYPFGHMVGKMFEQKFLNAVSVGFDPIKFSFAESNERFGIDFEEQELLEYSPVPVPSNPDALIQARSAGIDLSPMVEWTEQMIDEGSIIISREKLEKLYANSKSDRLTVDMGNGAKSTIDVNGGAQQVIDFGQYGLKNGEMIQPIFVPQISKDVLDPFIKFGKTLDSIKEKLDQLINKDGGDEISEPVEETETELTGEIDLTEDDKTTEEETVEEETILELEPEENSDNENVVDLGENEVDDLKSMLIDAVEQTLQERLGK